MKEVKLRIPNEWSDITIGIYQEYVKIQESKASEKNKVIRSLALLCNTSPFVVKKMAYTDLLEIMNIIKGMIDTEPKEEDFVKVFTFSDIEFGFVPNLNKLTTGEYIDLESYCKNPIENLHIIMSILYRKVTNKVNDRYAIEPYNPDEFKEELFKDCPMNIALSSLGFFLTLGERLAKTSLRYLEKQEVKQQRV
jgi:hypothetical protein|tara:strand:+ start:7241 stop:7822 length:582 start_codon:yes stop_codon:yes gene_type:complete